MRYVLEGSVQRDGNRVRVNAQLVDGETGAHLWADRFEDDLADLFKLQDQVVARLANALGYELVKAEAGKGAHSTNPELDRSNDARLGPVKCRRTRPRAIRRSKRSLCTRAGTQFAKCRSDDRRRPDRYSRLYVQLGDPPRRHSPVDARATFVAPHLPQCFLQVCSFTYFLHDTTRVGWAFGLTHRREQFDVFSSRLPGFTRRRR